MSVHRIFLTDANTGLVFHMQTGLCFVCRHSFKIVFDVWVLTRVYVVPLYVVLSRLLFVYLFIISLAIDSVSQHSCRPMYAVLYVGHKSRYG